MVDFLRRIRLLLLLPLLILCFVPDSVTLGNGIHYVAYSCEAVVESLTLLSNGFRYIV